MKPTGIVRRIDELGRVVIPKELRRTMHIKEGEEMEVYVDNDANLVLRKYSAVKAMADFSQEYAEIIYDTTGFNCIITDNDGVIACGTDKTSYADRPLTKQFERYLNGRRSAYLRGEEVISIVGEEIRCREMALSPIICNGDVLGGIVLVSNKTIGEVGSKLVEVASNFLGKQCE